MPKKTTKTIKTAKPKKMAESSCVCAEEETKPIGEVTHYFGGINVAIVKFKKNVGLGEVVKFKGASTDFEQKIESMQYEHKDIKSAAKNQEVGIKVSDKVREGDMVYPVE